MRPKSKKKRLSVVKVCRVEQNRIFFVGGAGRANDFDMALNLLFPVVDVMAGEIAQNQSMSCTLQRLTTFVNGHFVAIWFDRSNPENHGKEM